MTRPAGSGANLRWQPRDAINSGAAPANYMAPPATRMAHTLFLPRMPHMRMLQTAGPQRPAPAELWTTGGSSKSAGSARGGARIESTCINRTRSSLAHRPILSASSSDERIEPRRHRAPVAENTSDRSDLCIIGTASSPPFYWSGSRPPGTNISIFRAAPPLVNPLITLREKCIRRFPER